MALKPKPAWLNNLTGAGMWVTIVPDIFYPSTVTDPAAPEHRRVVVHEGVHIRQQRNKFLFVCFWMPCYIVSRKFRLSREVEAIAAEIFAAPEDDRAGIKDLYARLLSTEYRPLRWSRPAAKSYDHAMAAIVEALRVHAQNMG